MPQNKVIRVVVASPGDVGPERNALEDIVHEINHSIAPACGIHFHLSRWETDTFPGVHMKGPQGLVDSRLKIEDCDLLIGIFWKRFGTPVPNAGSGTEHEIRTAIAEWRKKRKPDIMLYFNQKPYTLSSQAEGLQWSEVLGFKNALPREALWWEYAGKLDFERRVRHHLLQYLGTLIDARPKQGPTESEQTPSSLDIGEPAFTSSQPDGNRPRAISARRPLHFIWLVDCSPRLAAEAKLQGFNTAFREIIPRIAHLAYSNPGAQVLVSCISYARGANWHITPTQIEEFKWVDLETESSLDTGCSDLGCSDLGAALKLASQAIKPSAIGTRILSPIIVLCSATPPTDDYEAGLRALLEVPAGRMSVRLAVRIGNSSASDVLDRFIGNPDLKPLPPDHMDSVLRYMRWAGSISDLSVLGENAIW
jgi:uncharacterized protein YegL